MIKTFTYQREISFPLFIGILTLEGYFISWSRSPYSWICSWLFIGLCYFSITKKRMLWFALGQMLLAIFFFQHWSFIGILLNPIISILLSVIFPMTLCLSLIPQTKYHVAVEQIMEIIADTLLGIDQIHQYFVPISPGMGHLIVFISWIVFKGKARFLFIPILVLTLSNPTNLQKSQNFSNSKWELVSGHGIACKSYWSNHRWDIKCRPKKGSGTKS